MEKNNANISINYLQSRTHQKFDKRQHSLQQISIKFGDSLPNFLMSSSTNNLPHRNPPPQKQPILPPSARGARSTLSTSQHSSSDHIGTQLRSSRTVQGVTVAQSDGRPLIKCADDDEQVLDSSGSTSWAQHFCRQHGNEFFSLVPYDYMSDRFNLTNLSESFDYFQPAWRVITSVRPATRYTSSSTNSTIAVYPESSAAARIGARHALPAEILERSAVKLYGLIHARYVMSNEGCLDVLRKFRRKDYGTCPRFLCEHAPVLPVGITDRLNVETVKIYCASCDDVYEPRAARHRMHDGAYFGTGLPHMLYMTHPTLRPARSQKTYKSTLYGFRLANLEQIPTATNDLTAPSANTNL